MISTSTDAYTGRESRQTGGHATLSGGADPSDERGVRAFGAVAAFLTGLVGIVILADIFLTPSSTVSTALTVYQQHQFVINLGPVAAGVFAIVGVPFYVSLGRLLRSRGPSVATSATLLAVVGVFVIAIAIILLVGITAAASGALSSATAPQQAVAPFVVGILQGAFTLLFFGVETWFVGILLLGLLMWNSRIFPNWLSLLGIVVGALGIVALGPVFFLFIAGFVAFIVWAFATGVSLWRLPAHSSSP